MMSCRLNPPINIYKRILSSSPKSPPTTPLGVQRYDNNGQDQRARQQGADLLVGHDPRAAAPRRDGPRRAAGVGKTIEDLRRRAVAPSPRRSTTCRSCWESEQHTNRNRNTYRSHIWYHISNGRRVCPSTARLLFSGGPFAQ